jgi:hypothetical protein
VVLGWLICIVGWLFIPLLVAAIVDLAMQRAEREAEVRMKLYRFFRDAGVREDKLDQAVERGLASIKQIIHEDGR